MKCYFFVDVLQKTIKFCKAIILQLKINKLKINTLNTFKTIQLKFQKAVE